MNVEHEFILSTVTLKRHTKCYLLGTYKNFRTVQERSKIKIGKKWCSLGHSSSDCNALYYYFMIGHSCVRQSKWYYCLRVVLMLVTRYLSKASLILGIQGDSKDKGLGERISVNNQITVS